MSRNLKNSTFPRYKMELLRIYFLSMSLVRVFHSPQSRSQKDNTKIPLLIFFQSVKKRKKRIKKNPFVKYQDHCFQVGLTKVMGIYKQFLAFFKPIFSRFWQPIPLITNIFIFLPSYLLTYSF